MRPVDTHIRNELDTHIEDIGAELDADVVAVASPIVPGLDLRIRDAIDKLSEKKRSIAVILDTPGGIVEVVERIVTTLRWAFDEVLVIVPDRAMSAGTILALSADRIMMDYFSCLGPIDPQIEKDGKLVPALSYLNQFDRLNQKASTSSLTTAEYALVSKLDLGELYQFEQARELSVELLVKWLSTYKFKAWKNTKTRKIPVTDEMRVERAEEIAALLNETARWHSHARGIDKKTLCDEVGLQVEDLAVDSNLHQYVRIYFELLKDYMSREQLFSFVHTRGYF